MSSGMKRGQFQRQPSTLLGCVSPAYLLVFIAAVLCLIGFHSYRLSSRMDRCNLEVKRYRTMLVDVTQQKMILDGRLTELRTMLDKKTKQLPAVPDAEHRLKKSDEKDKRVLTLEKELVEAKDKLDRCGNMAFRAQSKMEEESNIKSSTVIRNKTQCDVEINRQYEEIDKWIKSMVDDRTYSQFQMKFGKEGEKSETEKLQRLDKIVMQRDEIKAAKDEKVKEEIREREAKLEAQEKKDKAQGKTNTVQKAKQKKFEEEPHVWESRAVGVHRDLSLKDRSLQMQMSSQEDDKNNRHPANGILDTRFMQDKSMHVEPKHLEKKPKIEPQHSGANKLDDRNGRLPVRAPVRTSE